jgi:hypothetical protein
MNIEDFLTDFELKTADMKLRAPHAVAVHIAWLNWGNVGDQVFEALIKHTKAEKVAEFVRPGDFYNFVSYRERSHTYVDNRGVRHAEYPNSAIYCLKREEPLSDLVFLNLLEPTQFGEIFVDRVVALMKKLRIVRYEVVGAMGSSVPHTRPIIITGRSTNPEFTAELKKAGMRETSGVQYQGPTSIFNLISMKLQNEGVATASLIANLPTYFSLEDTDFNGVFNILQVLAKLESLEVPLNRFRIAGKRQYDNVSAEVRLSDKLASLVRELESNYDQDEAAEKLGDQKTELPPSIQKAINEIFDEK